MKSKQSQSKGFTLIEVIISLVILAILMTAVGLAFSASATNYAENEAMYEALNKARQALLRITSDIRTAQGVAQIDGGVTGDIDNRQCSLFRTDGTDITYHYNTSAAASYNAGLADNTLYMIINTGPSAGNYRLCQNVTNMTFDRAVAGSNVRNVRIGMTVTDDLGQFNKTIHTAAVVRTVQ
ncbi:MAG: type II secretion system protein [Sedimentisphaerales bacterium]|nr:type II secretion system protein [Sedimentisphaerales bacterium]